MKRISVIVPVYNAMPYLSECLDSLLNQTCPDLEVILVNDSSTDGSPEVMEEYVKKAPSRFVLMNTEVNRGAGGARNLGLSKASGKYVGFVDSDDIIEKEMFEKLLAVAESIPDGYDMVECGYFDQERDVAEIYVTDEMVGKVTPESRSELIVSGGYLWNRIVKRTFFQRPEAEFREKCILEDADILTWLFAEIDTIGQCKEILYRYMNRGASLSHQRLPESSYRNLTMAMKAEYEKARKTEKWPEIQEAVEFGLLQMYLLSIKTCMMMVEQGGEKEEAERKLKEVRSLRNSIISGSYENRFLKKRMEADDVLLMRTCDQDPKQLLKNLKAAPKESVEERTAAAIAEGNYREAIRLAWEGIQNIPDNYELLYAAGIAEEELGHGENAFYLYQLALLLAKEQKKAEDEATIRESFNHLCGYADATEYRLGRAFQELLSRLFQCKAYQTANLLIMNILYHENSGISKPALTEENMLYAMMLEIVLCEERRKGAVRAAKENTALSYGNDPTRFREAYRELKFMIRRIWFGFAEEKQKELLSVLKRYPVSSDMLSVVSKYAVPPEYWGALFERLVQLTEKEKELSNDLNAYLRWMKDGGFAGEKTLYPMDTREPERKPYRKLEYTEDEKTAFAERKEDEKSIAFIFLTNDALYAKECVHYIDRLTVPEGWKTEILEVWGAPGMAAGYNFAARKTDAAIRIFLHHDTFLIEKELLLSLTDAFNKKETPGMIGIFGGLLMDERALWYKNDYKASVLNLFQDAVLTFLFPKTEPEGPVLTDGAMLDGVFLAENAGLSFREDLFDGWHFYDISQSVEMRNAGYFTAFIADKNPWALHETTMRREENSRYEYYRQIFLNNYQNRG